MTIEGPKDPSQENQVGCERAVPKSLVLLSIGLLYTTGAVAAEPPSLRLTLEQALDRARQVAPALAAQRELLAQRRAEASETRSAYLPTAGLRLSETVSHSRNSDGPLTSSLSEARHAVGLALDATLLDFGRRAAAVDAADYALEAQQHRRRSTESDVVFFVADLYLRVLAGQELAAARDTNVVEQQKTLKGIQLLADKGLRPDADVTRARAEVARAEIDARVARDQNLLDARSLAITLRLTGEPHLSTPEPALLHIDLEQPGLVASVTRLDPEIAAERAQLQQAGAIAEAAKAARYPVLDVNASAGGARGDALGTLDPNGARLGPVAYNLNLEVGAALRWNLLDATVGDRADAAAAAARAQAGRLRALSEALELEALSTLHAARQAALLLQRAEEQYAIAELSVHQERERYRVGEGSLLQWLDAQRLLHEARLERIQARLQRDTASVRLRLLLHGGTRL